MPDDWSVENLHEERRNTLRDLGERVRRKREDLGLSLRDVHQRTRISLSFLEGIERGEYEGFPSPVFTRGFIRTYLGQIGEEALWEEFLPFFETPRELEPCPNHMTIGACGLPARGFRQASKFGLFAILLMAVLGTSWYVWFTWDREEIPSFTVREIPGVRGDGQEDVQSGDEGPSNGEAPVEETGVQAVLPPSPPPVPPEETPKVEEDRNLTITADGDCWIQIRSGNRTIFSKTIHKGESITYKADERLYVTYGRSPSVTVRWNGEDLGHPGRNRGVERIYYDPDGTMGGFAK